MKNHIIFLFFFSLLPSLCFSQRYLTPIFSAVEKTNNIEYGNAIDYQNNNQILLLDFYEPQNDTETKRPLIIYAHGGGFTDVNQTKELVHIVAYCDSMARRGYVVASIDYRLDETISNRAVINAMHDMKAAIRFFKKEKDTYNIDTSLIILAGESAGAVTALASNYIDKSSETNYPPTLPLSSDNSVEGNSGNPNFSSKATATLCYCGGTATVLNDLMFDTLAMESNLDEPLFQVHGTADPLIPISKALEVAVRANHLGLPALFHTFDGATHCPWFFPLDNSWDYLDTLIDLTTPFLYALVQESTSTNEVLKSEHPFKIFPNPSSGIINLDFGKMSFSEVEVEIFDFAGKIIFTKKINQVHQQYSIPKQFDSGLFFVKIKTEDREAYLKLIVH